MIQRLLAAALALVLICAPAHADEPDDVGALVDRMMTALQAGDHELSWRTSVLLLEREELRRLPDSVVAELYGAAGAAAFFYSGDQREMAEAAALERFDESIRLGSSNPVTYLFRGLIHASDGEAEQAASDLLSAERLRPGIANDLRSEAISPILYGLRAVGLEQAHAEFVSYFEANWRPNHPFDSASLLALEAARLDLRKGDLDAARAHAQSITASATVLILQTHREFEPLWRPEGPELQEYLRTAIRAEADELAADMESHPEYLEGPLYHADALARLGDYETAYALSLETYAQALDGAFPADTHEQFATLLSNLASYELGLGDYQAALERLERASEIQEAGVDNVTQRLMMAQMLVLDGRAEAALEALGDYNALALSSGGVGSARSTSACVHHLLGDTAARDADIAVMREDFAARADRLQFVYACMDDLESAAALMVERLRDPQQRLHALDELQVRNEPDSRYRGPLDAMLEAHADALRAHEDVRAAAAEVGRIVVTGVYY
jgi:tetratricopeptide (TPR) repeat protein